MQNQFDNKRIVIFGGSGSWGTELIAQLLKTKTKKIISFARNEYRQISLKRKFNNSRLKIIIGDIRDYEAVDEACKKVDIIFLLAAIKHIPLAEEFPHECIKTNINGVKNVVKASIINEVKRVIDVSSDKACAPTNVYGATKMIGERLILHGNSYNSKTEFQCIRGGNAIGSSGSVIPLFIDQIKKNNKITLTDKRMTRYFITLPEAIQLLFTAIKSNIINATYIINMPACKIIDLAEVLIEYYGNKNTKIKTIGIRTGEKLHELLISKTEALNSYIYGKKYYFICPSKKDDLNLPKVTFKEYNSSTNLMNKDQIKELLDKGGFLR